MSSPYQPYGDATPAATPSGSSRIAAILAHLSAPIAALLSAGSLSLLGPLLVWLWKKNDPYTRRAAAGAFNFNLTSGCSTCQLAADLHGDRRADRHPADHRPVRGVRVVPHQGRDPRGRRPAYDYPFQIRVLS